MQYSAICVSTECNFQSTMKIQESNDSCSAKKEYRDTLDLQLKVKLKLPRWVGGNQLY